MKIYQILIIALVATVLLGCATSESNSNAGDRTSVPPVDEKASEPAKKAVEPEVSYPKESYSQTTPTEAFKTYIMATVNKDVAALKTSLSKGSLDLIEKSAKEQGKTVEEILTGGAVENESKQVPQIQNEKITGNTATVDFKDASMPDFLTMPLVKENGTWKVALDQFQRELLEKLSRQLKNA
jgi:Domain of unknown function (DUF4878)